MIYWLARLTLPGAVRQSITFRGWHLCLDLIWLGLTAGALVWWGLGCRMIVFSLLLLYALVVTITDFSARLIPDLLTYPLLAAGLLLAVATPCLELVDALVGGLVGLGLFWLIAVAGGRVFRRPAMGGGDIKMAAALGVFLGWPRLLLAVFLGCILALVGVITARLLVRRTLSREVPFGPFLAFAGSAASIFGEALIALYLRSVGL